MGALERKPAAKELVRLTVEYGSADDFLTAADQTLQSGTTFIETTREIAVDTIIEIGISFPGFLQTLVLDALVKQLEPGGIRVTLLEGETSKLTAIVDGVRSHDPKVVAPTLKVLIVEDNKHVSDLVRQGLVGSTRRDFRDVTFSFETAENGAIALELFKTRSFDAAIVDVYLPVLDGATLIHQVRTALGLKKLPIITMSAGGDSARTAALRAGASVFLDKPVRLREVVATMRQLLSV